MKIATFNCNSVRSRLPIVTDWLKENAPDALGLQETKVVDEDFPEEAFRQIGYEIVFRGQKSYNGVALATRSKAKDVRFGLDDGGDPDGPRLAHAVVDGVVIVNTYVPQGHEPDSDRFAYKLEWLDRLRDYFDRHYTKRKRIVWIGDLNIAPEPIDVYDHKRLLGHVCHHPAVFEKFEALVNWGFVDVFRKHRPDAGEYSYFDYRMRNGLERGLGWRVDHILATPPMAKKSMDAWIDLGPRKKERPSDHTFVVAQFDV